MLNAESSIMTLIVKNASYIVQDPETILRGLTISVEGNKIGRIGNDIQPRPQDEVIDAAGCVVIPGLINAHTHLYQNFMKGIAPGLPLVPWCNQVLFPTVGAIRQETREVRAQIAYLWSAMASIEMIRSGITCCLNMDTVFDDVMTAWVDAGMRGIMGYTLVNKWVPEDLRASEDVMRQKTLEFVEKFHDPNGLTRVFMAPSTLFLCDDGLLLWAKEQAARLDLGMQIHIAEIASEVSDSIAETGLRPVERLKKLGLLSPRLSAVHCCHLTAEEIMMLGDSGTMTVHCPKSNMKLADGVMPVRALREAGVTISLGNDGCASNDLLDMWEEMRAAVMLARISSMNADECSPQDAFRMATVNGARTCQIDAGEIREGKLADMAIVSLDGVHINPLHDADLLNSLVFCGRAADVKDTIINGRVVMRDRKITTLDEAAIIDAAGKIEAPLYRNRSQFAF
jgi:5-methylthioadenosine/S-adenosylhomocysteine deaminase